MLLLSEDDIRRVEQSSKGQPYISYVSKLKSLGVNEYEVIVNGGHRSFILSSGQQLHIKGRSPEREIANDLNIDALVAAIDRNRSGVSDYNQFLQEIAAAGVHSYTSDLRGMEILYRGKNRVDFYVENIQELH